MDDNSIQRDKPWRPGDYLRLGPSWEEPQPIDDVIPLGVPDGED